MLGASKNAGKGSDVGVTLNVTRHSGRETSASSHRITTPLSAPDLFDARELSDGLLRAIIGENTGEAPQHPPIIEDLPDEDRLKSELVGERYGEIAQMMFRAETAYRMCRFDVARVLTESLMESKVKAIALSAAVTHMASCVASGDSDPAFVDLQTIKRLCSEGFESEDEPLLRELSIFAALRVEGILMTDIFEIPDIDYGIGLMPLGWELYYGFLAAQRALRLKQPERAAGIAEAFLMVAGKNSPLSRVLLHLATASADVMVGNLEDASNHFMDAWNLSLDHQIVMPFVEMSFMLLGLPRSCFAVDEPAEYRWIESMARVYLEGWYGLRAKCGLEDESMALAPLEMYVAALVVLGWRNKEIAAHLNISESTVKHQLTTVYQKMRISSRAELREMYGY